MKRITGAGATVALLIFLVFFTSRASDDENILWAKNLKADDVAKIEAVRMPSNENERYRNYDPSEFDRVVEIINGANGRKRDKPEARAGAGHLAFYVTVTDGTRHRFTNVNAGSDGWLVIDGIYYTADDDWLSGWEKERLNSKAPDDFVYE